MTATLATDIPTLSVDPFSDAFLENPYPDHARMRDAGPVVFLERYRIHAVARHADVSKGLADWENFSSARGVGIDDFKKVPPRRPASILLEVDPPYHTRTRTVMQRVLSPGAVKVLREKFTSFAADLIDKLVERGNFDAVTDLAEVFPLKVFPDAVGIGDAGRENLLPFSNGVFNSFGPPNERFNHSMAAMAPIVAWINGQCARERLAPGGFGAQLWEAHDAGEIDATEAPILVRSLLTAGLDTTVNAIGNTLLAFAENPGEWAKLRADRGLVKPMFDESLRYESPVQTFFRTTTRPVEIDGVVLPADEKVLFFLASANRDPRKWIDPNRFDVARRPIGHVAFGNGIHTCVGQLIARLEVELVFQALAEKVATIELAEAPIRRLNNTVRGLSSLPLRVKPA